MRPNLLDMTLDQLRSAMVEMGEKPYRAGQLADWVYRKRVSDPAAMTNLPATLVERFDLLTSRIVQRLDSKDGTVKLVVALADDQCIETVLIPAADRVTACLSTQVGCAMGCTFCASQIGGLKRDCTAAEMLHQILHLSSVTARPVTNVVFMGTGEPLANFDATVAALEAVCDPERFGISPRRVTVSTVGLPRQMRALAALELPFTLAISLHAPNDALRRELIPTAARIPLSEIFDAAEAFFASRGRRITLEYLLLAGVNDSQGCADQLSAIARRLRSNVNLIRYNPVASLPYRTPSGEVAQEFADRLKHRGVEVSIRRSRGLDSAAACGQLTSRPTPPMESGSKDR